MLILAFENPSIANAYWSGKWRAVGFLGRDLWGSSSGKGLI